MHILPITGHLDGKKLGFDVTWEKVRKMHMSGTQESHNIYINLFTAAPNDPKVPNNGVISGSKMALERSSNDSNSGPKIVFSDRRMTPK